MPNYSKTSIYKICCKDTTIKDIYIGSTCNFIKRKYQHKSSCHNENTKKYNLKVYQFIRDNGGWFNWDMIQIKEFSCENKREKETEERKHIEELKSTLNSNIPTRSKKEWTETNINKVKKQRKEYKSKNKEKINKKNKEWYKKNLEKGKEYRIKHKEYYDTYRLENKEYSDTYRLNNKESIKEYNKERYLKKKEDLNQKIGCKACKCMIRKGDFTTHCKTKKHLNNL